VVSFTTRPLYPQGKSPWYPLDRRLGGPQSRSGCGGEEKNSEDMHSDFFFSLQIPSLRNPFELGYVNIADEYIMFCFTSKMKE
jgi:hypothetical protein